MLSKIVSIFINTQAVEPMMNYYVASGVVNATPGVKRIIIAESYEKAVAVAHEHYGHKNVTVAYTIAITQGD